MPVHVIIDITVKNEDIYSEYLRKVPPIVKQFGGRYLVRGGKVTSLSGGWQPERVIILEFDNAEQVNNWLASPEYTGVASLREDSTITKAVMIESGVLP